MNNYLDKIRKLTESELKENGYFMFQQKLLDKSAISKITIIEPFSINDYNNILYKGKCVVTIREEFGSLTMNCTFDGIGTLENDNVKLSPSPIILKKR